MVSLKFTQFFLRIIVHLESTLVYFELWYLNIYFLRTKLTTYITIFNTRSIRALKTYFTNIFSKGRNYNYIFLTDDVNCKKLELNAKDTDIFIQCLVCYLLGVELADNVCVTSTWKQRSFSYSKKFFFSGCNFLVCSKNNYII